MIEAILPETVAELMNDPSVVLDVADRVSEAEAAMILADCRHAPVTQNGALVGIVSMRDVLAAELPSFQTTAEDQVRHLAELQVERIMTRSPTVVAPHDSPGDAARLLLQRSISSLPVLDAGRLVGIVTTTDFVAVAVQLLEAQAARAGRNTPVSEIMKPAPMTVDVSDRVDVAELLMKHGHFRHLPVLDGEKLVGMLSDRDILAALRPRLEKRSPTRRLLDKAAITVDKAMKRWPYTLPPEASVVEAGALLLEHRIGALPILDGKRLVGIVTERDYLRAFQSASDRFAAGAQPHA